MVPESVRIPMMNRAVMTKVSNSLYLLLLIFLEVLKTVTAALYQTLCFKNYPHSNLNEIEINDIAWRFLFYGFWLIYLF